RFVSRINGGEEGNLAKPLIPVRETKLPRHPFAFLAVLRCQEHEFARLVYACLELCSSFLAGVRRQLWIDFVHIDGCPVILQNEDRAINEIVVPAGMRKKRRSQWRSLFSAFPRSRALQDRNIADKSA